MITVLGDGAWGTAIAILLAKNGFDVTLWCHNPNVAESVQAEHKNHLYLPKFDLSKKIVATVDLRHALEAEIVFEAIPVKFMRSVLERCKPYAQPGQVWIGLSKGIENKTLRLPTEIIQDVLGSQVEVAVVSGPSYAHDLALGQPTGVTVAAKNPHSIAKIKKIMQNDAFCLESSSDLLGVQLAGALKNIFALGIGLLAGAGYGANSQALLMMRGLQECKVLLEALGYQTATLYSFAGIGDVVLTSFGGQSRNYKVGVMLGEGKTLDAILDATGFTPEAVNTLISITQLCEEKNVTLPLCTELHNIIFKQEPITSLLHKLCCD